MIGSCPRTTPSQGEPDETPQLLASGAGANPLLPNGWEIAATIFGFLFVIALLAFPLLLIVKLARGSKTRAAVGSDRAQLQDEIARRTESIERRLANIERTLQEVAE